MRGTATHREPSSALRLQRAIERIGLPRADNPGVTTTGTSIGFREDEEPAPDAGRYVVAYQQPLPHQPWVRVESFSDRSIAIDDCALQTSDWLRRTDGLRFSLAAASLVRVTIEGSLEWLGVIDTAGVMREVPSLRPEEGPGRPDWARLWEEGPAEEMIRQSRSVDRWRLVLAACSVARTRLSGVPGGASVPRSAIWASDQVAREKGSVRSSVALLNIWEERVKSIVIGDVGPGTKTPAALYYAAEPAWAAARAAKAAIADVRGDGYGSPVYYAAEAARGAVKLRSRAAQLKAVEATRLVIPLGHAILARLGVPVPELADVNR